MSLRPSRELCGWVHSTLCLALVFQPAQVAAQSLADAAAEQQEISARVATSGAVDVALRPGGLLAGQLLDQQGAPVAATELRLSNGRQAWKISTKADGRFVGSNLKGGTYVVQRGERVQLVRLWSPGTAPPHAAEGLLLLSGDDTVRGKAWGNPARPLPWERLKYPLANPWVFGGIVATAVAIPVAIHNADDDDAPAEP